MDGEADEGGGRVAGGGGGGGCHGGVVWLFLKEYVRDVVVLRTF